MVSLIERFWPSFHVRNEQEMPRATLYGKVRWFCCVSEMRYRSGQNPIGYWEFAGIRVRSDAGSLKAALDSAKLAIRWRPAP